MYAFKYEIENQNMNKQIIKNFLSFRIIKSKLLKNCEKQSIEIIQPEK